MPKSLRFIVLSLVILTNMVVTLMLLRDVEISLAGIFALIVMIVIVGGIPAVTWWIGTTDFNDNQGMLGTLSLAALIVMAILAFFVRDWLVESLSGLSPQLLYVPVIAAATVAVIWIFRLGNWSRRR